MGGLYYPRQLNKQVIGSRADDGTLTRTTLATSYDGSTQKEFNTGGFSHASFAFSYQMGSGETGNSIEVRLEQSPAGDNWYQLTTDSTSSGTSTVSKREFTHTGVDAGESVFDITLDIAYEKMRIEAKETGVGTNAGSVFTEVTLSGK